MKKVFCNNCKHIIYYDYGSPECRKNGRDVTSYHSVTTIYDDCININNNNDCPNWEPKWYIRLWNYLVYGNNDKQNWSK